MKSVISPESARPTWTRFFVTLAIGVVCIIGTIAAIAQPAHLQKGQLLIDQIVAAQSQGVYTGDVSGTNVFLNRYGGSWGSQTDPSFIRFFDQATGTYAANYTTCAPLVTHLLKYTYGWDWKLIGIPDPLANGALVYKASPSAYHYVSAIKNHLGFIQRSMTLAEVKPGDIGARWEVGTDTGHAVTVVKVNFATAKAYPTSSTDTNFLPALAGATYVEMTVLDSSSTGHSNDTRLITYNGKTDLSGGIGEGVWGVFINAAGEIIGHTWSLPTSSYTKVVNGVTVINSSWLSSIKSRVELQSSVELVFGRLPDLVPIVP